MKVHNSSHTYTSYESHTHFHSESKINEKIKRVLNENLNRGERSSSRTFKKPSKPKTQKTQEQQTKKKPSAAQNKSPEGPVLHIFCSPRSDHNNAMHTKDGHIHKHCMQPLKGHANTNGLGSVKAIHMGEKCDLSELVQKLENFKKQGIQFKGIFIHGHGNHDSVSLTAGRRGKLTIPFGPTHKTQKGKIVEQSKKITNLFKSLIKRKGFLHFASCQVGSKLSQSMSKKLKKDIRVIGSEENITGLFRTHQGEFVNHTNPDEGELKTLEYTNGRLSGRVFTTIDPYTGKLNYRREKASL